MNRTQTNIGVDSYVRFPEFKVFVYYLKMMLVPVRTRYTMA